MLLLRIHRRLDHLGIGLSLLCALHCAFLPLVLSSLPLIGIGFLTTPYWEAGMISASFLVACYSLVNGYKRTKNKKPLIVLTIGFLLILGAKSIVSEEQESVLMVAGGLLVAIAHFVNWKLVHRFGKQQTCCSHNQCGNA
jgi:hypothetical protein